MQDDCSKHTLLSTAHSQYHQPDSSALSCPATTPTRRPNAISSAVSSSVRRERYLTPYLPLEAYAVLFPSALVVYHETSLRNPVRGSVLRRCHRTASESPVAYRGGKSLHRHPSPQRRDLVNGSSVWGSSLAWCRDSEMVVRSKRCRCSKVTQR